MSRRFMTTAVILSLLLCAGNSAIVGFVAYKVMNAPPSENYGTRFTFGTARDEKGRDITLIADAKTGEILPLAREVRFYDEKLEGADREAAFDRGEYVVIWYTDYRVRDGHEWRTHRSKMIQDDYELERICNQPLGVYRRYSEVFEMWSWIVAGDGKYHDSFPEDQRQKAEERLEQVKQELKD